MDRQTAEYYRKLAEYRNRSFKPEQISSIGQYYQSTYTDYYKNALEVENDAVRLREEWNDRVARAREARATGAMMIRMNKDKGPYISVSSLLDSEGNELDLNTIVKRQQWFSTSQGKMMPGKLGKVAETLRMTEMDYEEYDTNYKKYKQLYDTELSNLEKRNAQAREEFLKQKQEVLGNAQASAYRGATYTEKPL